MLRSPPPATDRSTKGRLLLRDASCARPQDEGLGKRAAPYPPTRPYRRKPPAQHAKSEGRHRNVHIKQGKKKILAARRGDELINLEKVAPGLGTDLAAILAKGKLKGLKSKVAKAEKSARVKGDFEYLCPIERPPKIICVGLNYADHARKALREAELSRALPARHHIARPARGRADRAEGFRAVPTMKAKWSPSSARADVTFPAPKRWIHVAVIRV